MKRTIGILAGLATLGMSVCLGSQAYAQNGAGSRPATPSEPLRTRIAVVNLVQVLKDYKKFQSSEAELKGMIEQIKKELEPLRAEILRLQSTGQAPGTTAADRDRIERELKQKTLDFQNKEEEKGKVVSKRQGELAVQIYHEVEDAVDLFARSNAIELVLMYNDAKKSVPAEFYNAANVQRKMVIAGPFMPIYIDPRMDITDAIIQMLNRRVAAYNGSGN